VYLRAADSWASTMSALVSMNATSVFVTCEQARNSGVVGLSALWHDQDGETSSDVDVSTDLDTSTSEFLDRVFNQCLAAQEPLVFGLVDLDLFGL